MCESDEIVFMCVGVLVRGLKEGDFWQCGRDEQSETLYIYSPRYRRAVFVGASKY